MYKAVHIELAAVKFRVLQIRTPFFQRDKRKLLGWYIQHRGRNTDVGREQNKQFLKLDIVLTDASRENDATGRLSMDDVPNLRLTNDHRDMNLRARYWDSSGLKSDRLPARCKC